MTVINAMKFNAQEGGMVADSQSSNQIRKYDLADKIGHVDDKNGTVALFGGSGATSLLYEAEMMLCKELADKEKYNVPDVANLLSEVMLRIKRNKINNYLISTFGVDISKAISGESIGAHLIPDIKDILTAKGLEFFNGGYILVGRDKNGVKIYNIGVGGSPFLEAKPYASIGSGTDESDKVLYGFVKDLKREDREHIPFIPGMTALIRATNASSDINSGVGGTPTISYFNEERTTFLTENQSKLATELVRVRDKRLISEEIADNCLEELLLQKADFEEVEKTAFENSEIGYKEIMRFLRGYKK